jgi:hypothetical protein
MGLGSLIALMVLSLDVAGHAVGVYGFLPLRAAALRSLSQPLLSGFGCRG